jgi:hypothetical protein
MSSVFDNPTSEEPGVAKIFSTKRKQQLKVAVLIVNTNLN